MADTLVLSEDEALELVAFLITAARMLIDEPVDYGPLRLLTAAQRLCTSAASRSGETCQPLFQRLADEIPVQVRRRNGDPEGYLAFMEESCVAVARALARRAGREV